MLYRYTAIDQITNDEKSGTVEATTVDIAIATLQRRKFVIITIVGVDDVSFWKKSFTFRARVSYRDVVIISRQISTLFTAQVSTLRIFQLLSQETENPALGKSMEEVSDDLQGGTSLTNALAKHPETFSDFYVNMVRAGEESGNLSDTFSYLADYLDRNYELVSKTRNALIYPAFVIVVFVVVMILMLVIVVPKLSAVILETGKDLPFYTKAVIGFSNFFVNYGLFMLVASGVLGFFAWQYARTLQGKAMLARLALATPYIGDLYKKLYLARIADNLSTMLTSGIAVVRAIEIASTVVGNKIYEDALLDVAQAVRSGVALSVAMSRHQEIPSIMIQMIKVGEETGEVGNILDTLAKFYKREVDTAVDTLIGLIEPAMIVLLGLGVGGLLTSILLPIYDITSSF